MIDDGGTEATSHVRAATGLLLATGAFLASLWLLVTGSPLLLLTVSERMGLPLGTPVTWMGMVALVLMVRFGFAGLRSPVSRADRVYRSLWRLSLALALLWPLAGYGLAGNWAFMFSAGEGFRGGQVAMRLFWFNSVAVVVLPLTLALTRLVHLAVSRFRGSRKTH